MKFAGQSVRYEVALLKKVVSEVDVSEVDVNEEDFHGYCCGHRCLKVVFGCRKAFPSDSVSNQGRTSV